MPAASDRTVPCPICKRPIPAAQRDHRPFCSARCKTIDLGNWLGGTYAVPSTPADDEDGGALPDDEHGPPAR
jgi:uncharacterized protein